METLHHILLIDPDEASNLINRTLLKKSFITDHIHITQNGREAIQFLTHTVTPFPELILLDINMPKMDGFEFLDYWKNNNFTGKSRIVIYTSSARSEDIARMRQYEDVIAYLEKPLNNTKIAKLLDLIYTYT